MEHLFSKIIPERKKKLVIVEDEVLSSSDMSAFLSSKGYDVAATAVNADEAFAAVSEHLPDVVLMDIRIKGDVDGIDAAVEIRKRFGIPVIFITAYADRITLERAKVADPYGYILKPFAEHDLFATVEMAINKRDREQLGAEREAWFSAILKNVADGVIVLDCQFRVVFSNIAAGIITGFSENDLAGKTVFEVLNLSRDNFSPSSDSIGMRLSKITRKDGVEIDAEYNFAHVGHNDAAVFFFRDVSERLISQERAAKSLSMLRKAMSGVIQSMAATVETRDPYTAGHQKRVTELARHIADELGLGEDEKEGIRMAGIIHDIGKISVPAEILSKPGKLSDIEFSLIKTHPQAGYEILKNIDFPWPVALIVKQHHERFDGSGYPDGVSGKDILIEARVLSVADVVEAMASHRPYRASLGVDAALSEIIRYKGILYDPDVVEACERVFLNRNFVFEGGTF